MESRLNSPELPEAAPVCVPGLLLPGGGTSTRDSDVLVHTSDKISQGARESLDVHGETCARV